MKNQILILALIWLLFMNVFPVKKYNTISRQTNKATTNTSKNDKPKPELSRLAQNSGLYHPDVLKYYNLPDKYKIKF